MSDASDDFVAPSGDAPSAAAAGRSREVDDRMFCNSCGTVSSDGECDCTRTDAPEARDAEPYLAGLLISFAEIAKSERDKGNHAIANVITSCIEEIELLRSRLPPSAAVDATGAERVSNQTGSAEVEELVVKQWWLGSQNDGLFIINQPPRPSNDDQFHERTDGPSFVVPLGTLKEKHAQALVDEHNRTASALTSLSLRVKELEEALSKIEGGWIDEDIPEDDPHDQFSAALQRIARAVLPESAIRRARTVLHGEGDE
jgi:hypothetical protein